MTATSAPSASNANSFPAEQARTEIRLPGSTQTYEVRDVLRGMGRRWDPATHAWHGRLLDAQQAFLERRYRLAPKVAVPIEAFDAVQVTPALSPVPPRPPSGPRGPPRDYSRTHFESRIALPTLGDEPEEFRTAGRTFSLWETTSGLPDDTREEDERAAQRQIRDLRARVKRARAVVATTPGLSEILQNDWRKAARFYGRFGITGAMFRDGILAGVALSESINGNGAILG